MRPTDRPEAPTPIAGFVLRLFWMLFGNAALAFSAVFIARDARGQFSMRDALFWALVGALIGARYFDVARYEGTTADGTPATAAHFRRYTIKLLAASAVVWSLLHGSALIWN